MDKIYHVVSAAGSHEVPQEGVEVEDQKLRKPAPPQKAATTYPSSRNRRSKKSKPVAVKRALSAYNIFFRDERARILETREKGDFGEIGNAKAAELFSLMGKAIAKKWKELTPVELVEYTQAAGEDMKRYRKEMDDYHAKLDFERSEAASVGLTTSERSEVEGANFLSMNNINVGATNHSNTNDLMTMRMIAASRASNGSTSHSAFSREDLFLQQLVSVAPSSSARYGIGTTSTEQENSQRTSLAELLHLGQAAAGLDTSLSTGVGNNSYTGTAKYSTMSANELQQSVAQRLSMLQASTSSSPLATLEARWKEQQRRRQELQGIAGERTHWIATLEQELNMRDQEQQIQTHRLQHQLRLLHNQNQLRRQEEELAAIIRLQQHHHK